MSRTASRVILSYPADLSGWGREQLQTPWFDAYLRRQLDAPAVGDAHEEFLDVGCCGDALNVTLVVERIEGGGAVGRETELVWIERQACGVEGGWRVQSAAGPIE